jgi:hypothetical protein
MRLLYGAGAMAAVSALAVTMVRPGVEPASATQPLGDAQPTNVGASTSATLVIVDGTVDLPTGQDGARKDQLRARPASEPQRRRARARTRQSGA